MKIFMYVINFNKKKVESFSRRQWDIKFNKINPINIRLFISKVPEQFSQEGFKKSFNIATPLMLQPGNSLKSTDMWKLFRDTFKEKQKLLIVSSPEFNNSLDEYKVNNTYYFILGPNLSQEYLTKLFNLSAENKKSSKPSIISTNRLNSNGGPKTLQKIDKVIIDDILAQYHFTKLNKTDLKCDFTGKEANYQIKDGFVKGLTNFYNNANVKFKPEVIDRALKIKYISKEIYDQLTDIELCDGCYNECNKCLEHFLAKAIIDRDRWI